MILIKLYGILGEKANETELLPGLPRTIRIDKSNINNVMDILEKLNIAEEEISHIFINNQYCGAGYNVRDGDRVGIFPKKMALMFAEIPHLNSIPITISIQGNLRQYGALNAKIDVPKGSTIIHLIEKYSISAARSGILVEINGKKVEDLNHIIQSKDRIEFRLKN